MMALVGRQRRAQVGPKDLRLVERRTPRLPPGESASGWPQRAYHVRRQDGENARAGSFAACVAGCDENRLRVRSA